MKLKDADVALRIRFYASEGLSQVLALLSQIRDSSTKELTDNGVSQVVTTSKGVTLVGRTAVPNEFLLQPQFSFPESECIIDVPIGMRLKADGAGNIQVMFLMLDSLWRPTLHGRIAEVIKRSLTRHVLIIE